MFSNCVMKRKFVENWHDVCLLLLCFSRLRICSTLYAHVNVINDDDCKMSVMNIYSFAAANLTIFPTWEK